ncbi:type I glyceraldehyde-3-phosphate dehydrogenase [Candidatus Roizmanbacteria bacterium]|nr:type I glyceraldehyde-3-phosphate dehydrogenase [Candidatus Roizmanbacteria bacterium]
MRLKVGLNGFGRIGRAFTRIAASRGAFDIVLINTRKTPNDLLAYLLQYDSVYRKFDKKVTALPDGIQVGDIKIATSLSAEPAEIPWNNYGVDVVVDATGAFTKKEDLEKHIKGSVKKVLLTAPSKDDATPHVVLGVNDDKIDWGTETVISNASCTTNCAAPLFKVLDQEYKVVSGFLTTTHAYTLTQSLLDDANKNPDRSRAAPLNIAPSTTGAAKAVVKTLPQLKGKIDGMSVRVPVPTGSFTDISVVVERPTTVEEVNAAFKKASVESMKGILGYEEDVLVSSDFIGSPYSSIFDPHYTKVINGTFVKAFGWYDNEWGYSTRMVDLVEKLANYL